MRPHARPAEDSAFLTFARNVSTRYLAIAVNALVGLVVLPINVHYLGTSAYGLWMLSASVTTYFSVLDLGYGSAVVKFVAEYRAKRNPRALNEILSTLFTVFTLIGVAAYAIALVVAALMPVIFNLDPAQVNTGRIVLLIIAANVTLHFICAVYGGVVNGFQRYYLNNVIGTVTSIAGAVVNVAILWLGYGLIELVAATTLVRMAPYFLYRRNAIRAFPELSLRFGSFSRERLREVTGFSVWVAIIDWSARLSYSIDPLMIGIFLNTAAVGVYAVGLRLSEVLLRMTNQLQVFLFPAVVHRAVTGRVEDQRHLFVRATRFQIAVAIALCAMVAADADILIRTWVGAGFENGVVTAQILAGVVILRAWMAMPGTLLKGSGQHPFFAKVAAASTVANVLLSVGLVQIFGVVGVALGTLIPAATVASCVLFPAACREVALPVAEGYRRVVWPAVWPAIFVVAAVAFTRHAIPPRLVAVLAHLAAGAVTYAAVFFTFGLEREERQWFTRKMTELWRRRSQALAAA